MDSYKIEVIKSAGKDVNRINKQDIPRIIKAIHSLAADPFPLQHRKMKGAQNKY